MKPRIRIPAAPKHISASFTKSSLLPKQSADIFGHGINKAVAYFFPDVFTQIFNNFAWAGNGMGNGLDGSAGNAAKYGTDKFGNGYAIAAFTQISQMNIR